MNLSARPVPAPKTGSVPSTRHTGMYQSKPVQHRSIQPKVPALFLFQHTTKMCHAGQPMPAALLAPVKVQIYKRNQKLKTQSQTPYTLEAQEKHE